MPTPRLASIVILAAGLGTRMRSSTPKVLHHVCGLPLVEHVLRATRDLAATRTVVVLGHGHEQVSPLLPAGVRVALQYEQNGTGHAVLAAAEEILLGAAVSAVGAAAGGMTGRFDAPGERSGAIAADAAILVLPGDTPLVSAEVLDTLVAGHFESGVEATVLTMELTDPSGYGRVIRGADGLVERIVEHKDATPAERAVREVNSGMYVLPRRRTIEILSTLGTDNAQGELYLTDVVAALRRGGARVGAVRAPDARRLLGVNTRLELAEAQAIMQQEILRRWMLAGVTIDDPASTSIEADVMLEPDVRVLPFTFIAGSSVVAAGSVVGPNATIVNSVVGAGSRVYHSFVEDKSIAPGSEVGPFACLRAEG